jgi:hypothetical protein
LGEEVENFMLRKAGKKGWTEEEGLGEANKAEKYIELKK